MLVKELISLLGAMPPELTVVRSDDEHIACDIESVHGEFLTKRGTGTYSLCRDGSGESCVIIE